MSDSSSESSGYLKSCCFHMHSDIADLSDVLLSDDYNSSFTEESSDELILNDHKNIFISIYKNQYHYNTNLISNVTEIINYRGKYKQLPKKTTKNINNIWEEVKVDIPVLGHVSLKEYDDNFNRALKSKKKCLKKPNFIISKKNVITDSHTNKSSASAVISVPKNRVEKNLQKNISSKNSSESSQNILQNEPITLNFPQSKSKKNSDSSQSINQEETDGVIHKTTLVVNDKITKANATNNNESPNIHGKIRSNLINIETNSNNENIVENILEFKKPYDKIMKPNLSNNIAGSTITTNIQDNKTDENESNSNEALNNNELISKKNLKKQRQKEKKLESNEKNSSNSSSRDTSESNNKTLTPNKKYKNNKNNNLTPSKKLENNKNNNITRNKKSETMKNNDVGEKGAVKNNKKVAEKSLRENFKKSSSLEVESNDQLTKADEEEDMNDSDDNMDFLTNTETMPSFIFELVKRKQKNTKKISTKPSVEVVEKKIPKTIKPKSIDEKPFNIHTRKYEKPMAVSNKYILYSEKFGRAAIDMILENNFMEGLEYIVEAINYNPSDHRHILNRCYCYLRMNENALALADAQYVIKTSSNIGHIFMANLRAGQALFALQEYQQAEMYLGEATCINPENHHAQRQLMRVKITIIVNMGFKEKDALLALEIYPSTLEAINYLIAKNQNNSHSLMLENNSKLSNSSEDLIYSSDEDESPNNVQILNRILNYKPGKGGSFDIIAKTMNTEIILSSHGRNEKKNVTTNGKSANGQEKAIWVGNLTNNITEEMLKKKFKQFGNVVSIYRPLNEAYAFINFEKSEHVTNVLMKNSYHEIAGVKLVVRSAVRLK